MKSSDLQKYYRYESNVLKPDTPFLRTFLRVRDTPKGFVVISEYMFDQWSRIGKRSTDKAYKRKLERLVLHSSINKYCYPSKAEALKGFIKRQERRYEILSQQMESVEEFLKSVRTTSGGRRESYV